jgi:hypothetical protein
VRDLVVNLLASVVAGTAVWLAQRVLAYRRLARKRAFFGLGAGDECALVVSRHARSPSELSVHRSDVAALVELASIAKECGARADLVTEDAAARGVGRRTEFCVGGPSTNPRTGAHLRSFLPGVRVAPYDDGGDLAVTVGATTYRRAPDEAEYVVLARVSGPDMAHPVFVVLGQTARTNQAAARFLAARYPDLLRRFGTRARFCLVLHVREPASYGPDLVELAADATGEAFTATAAAADS